MAKDKQKNKIYSLINKFDNEITIDTDYPEAGIDTSLIQDNPIIENAK